MSGRDRARLLSLSLAAPLEREAAAQLAEALAPWFEPAPPVSGDRLGLIVVSDNAGIATALRFWADALRTGLAFASPELFPWTLANAVCGALARRFGISGPNLTLLGRDEALAAAADHAADWVAMGLADAVLTVAIHLGDGDGEGPTRATVWLAAADGATVAAGAGSAGGPPSRASPLPL